MTELGDAIAQLLHEQGMSQNELGRRLGVTGSAVNGWTRGKIKPSRDNLERIEDELAVEPRGYLLRLADYYPGLNGDEAPTVESLLRADPTIDPEDRRVLLRLYRFAQERHTAKTG